MDLALAGAFAFGFLLFLDLLTDSTGKIW